MNRFEFSNQKKSLKFHLSHNMFITATATTEHGDLAHKSGSFSSESFCLDSKLSSYSSIRHGASGILCTLHIHSLDALPLANPLTLTLGRKFGPQVNRHQSFQELLPPRPQVTHVKVRARCQGFGLALPFDPYCLNGFSMVRMWHEVSSVGVNWKLCQVKSIMWLIYHYILESVTTQPIHPGRLMAGTYKWPIFSSQNDLNQTSMRTCSSR